MTGLSYLIKRGATYYARIRVPLDLLQIVGKTDLSKALGTKDLPEAKRRLVPVLAQWHREFDDLRSRSILTPADQANAVWDHYTAALDRDEAERMQLPTADQIETVKAAMLARVQSKNVVMSDPLAVLDVSLDYLALKEAQSFSAEARKVKIAELRKHLAQNEMALIAHDVDAHLDANRLFAERSSPAWISMARAIARAELEALQRGIERDRGDYSGEPRDPLVRPATGQRRETAKPGESIMEVFEIFASENPRGVAQDRVNQIRRDIGNFVDLVGASFPITKIDKAAIRDWKQLLVKYPVKASESTVFSGMNLRQIIKANEKVGKPVLADRTVNRYLSSLSAFLAWAVNNGYIDRNPVEGLMLKKENQTQKIPFTIEQLQELFSSPWFVGCQSENWKDIPKPGNVLIRDHRYWVPLIMLFSGARPAEIGQLLIKDVRQEHGKWIFHVTTEGDKTKSVKTEGSMRVIPIHAELIRLGFLDYRAKIIATGSTSLFPDAKRNERGQLMAQLSREFSRYLSRLGIKTDKAVSLYSFRHGVADALRRAGYLDTEFGYLLGHTGATMTQRYGIMPQGMLEKRSELVQSIAYPGLLLDHLIP